MGLLFYISYVDDIFLLPAFVRYLQGMVDICFCECDKVDILFNASKVGKGFSDNYYQPLKFGPSLQYRLPSLNIWV